MGRYDGEDEPLTTAQTLASKLINLEEKARTLKGSLEIVSAGIYQTESALVDSLPDKCRVTYRCGTQAVTVIKAPGASSKIFVTDLV